MLYLDCDVLINADISTLYEEDVTNYLFAGVMDIGVNKHYAHERLNVDDGYFNAGVLLINLQKYKELNIQKRCIEIANRRTPIYFFQDQDILNMVAARDGGVKFLYPMYNMQWAQLFFHDYTYYYLEAELTEEDWENPYILHYNGRWKPWGDQSNHKYAKYWHDYQQRARTHKGE